MRAHSDVHLERSVFETVEGDQITGFLRSQYVDNDIWFAVGDDPPRFRASSTQTPDLVGEHLRSSIDYGGTCDPFDYFLFYICRHGQMRVDSIDHQQRLRSGDATFFPPNSPLNFDFRDLGLQVLRLPPGRVEEIAEQITGVAAASVRFDGCEPVSQDAHRRWNKTFCFVSRALTGDDTVPPSPLMAQQLARLLVAAALDTFPNTTMSRHYRSGPGYVAPAAIRRAVDYIEVHAHLRVHLDDIAAAAGTSIRALHYGFRRHLATTPLGYLHDQRLRHAHRDLQAADPRRGDTVAVIATQWGFTNPGRFAAAYRRTFGVPPSHTLRQ